MYMEALAFAPALPTRRPTFGEMRSPQEKLYDAEVLERVKRGMALLEEQYGPSWVDKIDMKKLGLQSLSQCVLGQLYGDFTVGASELGIKGRADFYGFDIRKNEKGYMQLQRAWEDMLTPLVTRS